jgi:uncharacterized low-complexity protein
MERGRIIEEARAGNGKCGRTERRKEEGYGIGRIV